MKWLVIALLLVGVLACEKTTPEKLWADTDWTVVESPISGKCYEVLTSYNLFSVAGEVPCY